MSSGIGSLIGAGGMSAASAIAPPLAAIGAGSELFKLGLSVAQAIRARNMAKSDAARRPTFTIPGAATNALNDQRNLAMGAAPGLSYEAQIQAQNNAATNAAIMNSGGGSAERLGALAAANQGMNQNALQMGAQQDQWKAQQAQNLIGAQDNYANWQQQAWEYNRNKPYEQINAAAKDLGNASNMNAYDALKSGGGLLSSAIKKGMAASAGTSSAAQGGLMGNALGKLSMPPASNDVAAPMDNTQLTTDNEVTGRLTPAGFDPPALDPNATQLRKPSMAAGINSMDAGVGATNALPSSRYKTTPYKSRGLSGKLMELMNARNY